MRVNLGPEKYKLIDAEAITSTHSSNHSNFLWGHILILACYLVLCITLNVQVTCLWSN
jgi:hypothetical protein